MGPLPISLSPHVLVLTSPDLDELLVETRKLQPLHQLLQSFSPLRQVTTRTTGLGSVTHSTFNIRFSSLHDVEESCKEDEGTRAERIFDWIGSRIAQQANAWLDDPRMVEHERWWRELRACVEGERAPSRGEGWNHPVALILATSTMAPNPLQAVTNLHARAPDLPSWVDQILLKYTLIVHPTPSKLNPDEAIALLNAVKKQFGLNTHLLQFPSTSSEKIEFEFPAPLPQLPSPSNQSESKQSPASQPVSLMMSETDAQNTSRFVREFTTMALIPWMERCVGEWNETFSSTRRIGSRLFGSTARRFFGSTSTVPTPTAPLTASNSTNSVSSTLTSSHSGGSISSTLPLHRRLAEFATVLGDYKLASSVWEVLRKEFSPALSQIPNSPISPSTPIWGSNANGSSSPNPTSTSSAAASKVTRSTGADVLPLILAPGVALGAHAFAALAALGLDPSGATLRPSATSAGFAEEGSEAMYVGPGAAAQMRALVYAVRWDSGIAEFESSKVDGERWLAGAAGLAEEPASALLLARAASISVRKGSTRRGALWFATAARRLEKSGIKRLTIHLFERADEARVYQEESLLSPTFFEIIGPEGRQNDDAYGPCGMKAFLHHSLGRLKYSSGDSEGAVRLFSSLLRPSTLKSSESVALGREAEKMYLADFRDALEHYFSTHPNATGLEDLDLPVKFCRPTATVLRLASDFGGSPPQSGDSSLSAVAAYWSEFCRRRGEKGGALDVSRMAVVEEPFWVDLALYNPLSSDVTLYDLKISVTQKDGTKLPASSVDIECHAQVVIPAGDEVLVPISIRARYPAHIVFPEISYSFLSLLPCSESLAVRGRRLNDTPLQRQGIVYAPDVHLGVEVRETGPRLKAQFTAPASSTVEETVPSPVFDGEIRRETIVLMNTGSQIIEDIWFVFPPDGNMLAGEKNEESKYVDIAESLEAPQPYHLAGVSLRPGNSLQLPITLRYSGDGLTTFAAVIAYRENSEAYQYFAAQAIQSRWIQPVLAFKGVVSLPTYSQSSACSVELELENTSGPNDLSISQISTLSSSWVIRTTHPTWPGFQNLSLKQVARIFIDVDYPEDLNPEKASKPFEFLATAVKAVLAGQSVAPLPPSPPVDLVSSNAFTHAPGLSKTLQRFVQASRRNALRQLISSHFPSIPPSDYHHIFPPYTPLDLDVAITWTIPSSISNAPARTGIAVLANLLSLGPRHGALRDVLRMARETKASRSMYAETKRERELLLNAIEMSRWNAERNPIRIRARSQSKSIKHDFANGPCIVPLTFETYNESRTWSTTVTLELPSSSSSGQRTSFRYIGSLTKRVVLPPHSGTKIQAKAFVSSPGVFRVTGCIARAQLGSQAREGTWVGFGQHMDSTIDEVDLEVSNIPEDRLSGQ